MKYIVLSILLLHSYTPSTSSAEVPIEGSDVRCHWALSDSDRDESEGELDIDLDTVVIVEDLRELLALGSSQSGNLSIEGPRGSGVHASVLNGSLNGEVVQYSSHGSPLVSGQFSDGIPAGRWTYFWTNGVPFSSGRILHTVDSGMALGDRDGVWTWWYENGAIRAVEHYEEGRLLFHELFNSDGMLVQRFDSSKRLLSNADSAHCVSDPDRSWYIKSTPKLRQCGRYDNRWRRAGSWWFSERTADGRVVNRIVSPRNAYPLPSRVGSFLREPKQTTGERSAVLSLNKDVIDSLYVGMPMLSVSKALGLNVADIVRWVYDESQFVSGGVECHYTVDLDPERDVGSFVTRFLELRECFPEPRCPIDIYRIPVGSTEALRHMYLYFVAPSDVLFGVAISEQAR